MTDFAGQVVWITGASSGIGEALAYEFARAGATLILSARRTELLEAVQCRCERPEAHLVLPFDMTQVDELPRQVDHVLRRFGRIDLLINNAGVSQRSLVQETALRVDRQIFETDFFAPVALVKAVLPHMLARGRGHVVVVSSIAGLVATPMRSSYSAAKAAIIAFHDSLRAETAEAGLNVSVLCPGFVATNIASAALTGDGSLSAGKHPLPKNAMSAQLFAHKAVSALASRQELIVIAGRERVLWWLSRISPYLASRLLLKVKVV
ncbi:MAG: dependent epimerase/dehydratase family [Myxococcaceae bacterium]|nr:dependent epimerase/dehydratase family [Myxococcaceae bacterium]